MRMKKKSGATTVKKAPAKHKPAAKKVAAPKKAAAKATIPVAPAAAPAEPRRGVYTPRPVQGTGWAPFRYPVT